MNLSYLLCYYLVALSIVECFRLRLGSNLRLAIVRHRSTQLTCSTGVGNTARSVDPEVEQTWECFKIINEKSPVLGEAYFVVS